MRKIDISTPTYPNTFALVDDEEYERINAAKWMVRETRDGQFYAIRVVCVEGVRATKLMHREIMNPKEGYEVDHIFHETLDNRKSKLRVCTHAGNAKNRLMSKNNTSGYKGVYLTKTSSKWLSKITADGKPYHLGYYDTAEDAAMAYDVAAIERHGEFANINNVDYTKQVQPPIDRDLYLDAHRIGHEVFTEEEKASVLDAIGDLTFRERITVRLRYGIEDGFGYTFAEIGRILKVTKERVRQIDRKAIFKLQEYVI